MDRITAIIASVAVVVLLGGIGAYVSLASGGSGDQFAQCRAGAVATGSGSIGGPFELLNAKGEVVTDADVITEPTLVYFGYTFCPDVCPFDAARNAEAVDILSQRGVSATPLFISVDPKRDTPEVVGDFAFYLHEKMIGLTGSEDQVAAASKAYRTYYKAQPAEDDFYLVDHSTFTYLVTPENGFLEFFRRDATAEQMADSVQCFVDAT